MPADVTLRYRIDADIEKVDGHPYGITATVECERRPRSAAGGLLADLALAAIDEMLGTDEALRALDLLLDEQAPTEEDIRDTQREAKGL